jgi:hypothetical protein
MTVEGRMVQALARMYRPECVDIVEGFPDVPFAGERRGAGEHAEFLELNSGVGEADFRKCARLSVISVFGRSGRFAR